MTAGTADSLPLVFCQRVSRTYPSGRTAVVAVCWVSCRVDPGDQIAITGPSGSGKSTLMHLLGGLDTPSTGMISWPALGNERVVKPGKIGMVFQGPSLLPPLSVLENVALPLILAGCVSAEAFDRARAALALVTVADLAPKLPDELSGGQAQRVAVARVLAAAPRLILADEPTGQLDAAHASTVIDTLVDVATELGAGLVVSTHDPLVASRLQQQWQVVDGRLWTGQGALC